MNGWQVGLVDMGFCIMSPEEYLHVLSRYNELISSIPCMLGKVVAKK